MRKIARLLLPLALLSTVTLFTGPSFARDPEKPSEQYAEKEGKFLRAIAAKYVELAEDAMKRKLFQFAREAYQEALVYDENQREARERLGYLRRSGKWILDPAQASKIPEQNTRPQNQSDTAFEAVIVQFEQVKRKVEKFAAEKYAGLGSWCEKEGLSDQAGKAFEKSLRLDAENKEAREGLGYELVDGVWLTKKQAKAREEAQAGKLVDDPSPVEGPLGIRLNKMESGHFRIETPVSVDALSDYVKNCETTYAYFLRDVGEDPLKSVWPARCYHLVLETQPQWHAWVDAFGTGDARQKDFTKKLQGSRDEVNVKSARYIAEGGHETTVDGLVHATAHFLARHHWGIEQAWLGEGFAYYYTVKVLESTRTHCVALGTYQNPGDGSKQWGQSENWKDLIKQEVLTGADPDVRMFYGLDTSALPYNASVKAWSLISWLFDKHREKFMQWLDLVGRGGRPQEEALQEVFGWSFEKLDLEWRAFVRETY